MEAVSRRGAALTFVLDASVTIAWLLPDERQRRLDPLFDFFTREGATVPSLWRLEVATVLLKAERRKRVPRGFTRATLDDLAVLPIAVDAETDVRAWRQTLALAERHRLTAYDASYLELAARSRLPLATLDVPLSAAAVAEGVELLLEPGKTDVSPR